MASGAMPGREVRNASPELRAIAVLDACERAVRACSLDYSDTNDDDAQFVDASLENFKSRIRVLKRQAAAAWTPQFTRLLESSHSLRVENVGRFEKEAVRTEKQKCMACGRWEHRCGYSVDLLGPFDHAAFNCANSKDLEDTWNWFVGEYEEGSNPANTQACIDSSALRPDDLGTFTIGKTCLRKTKLYFVLNTLILEACYSAHQAVAEAVRTSDGKIDTHVFANEQNANDFLARLQECELAIADEKRPIPEIGVDATMWSLIDSVREALCDDDEELFELLRARSDEVLTNHLQKANEPQAESKRQNRAEMSDDDDSDYDEGDDDSLASEYDEEEEQGVAKRKGKRTRGRVVLSSDDEDVLVSSLVEQQPWKQRQTRQSTRAQSLAQTAEPRARRSRRQRRLSPEEEGGGTALESIDVDKEEEEEAEAAEEEEPEAEAEEEAAGAETEEEEEEEARASALLTRREYATTTLGSRRPPPNAAEIAAVQRIPGDRLPARNFVTSNLSSLATRLIASNNYDDAATCTAAVAVLLEYRQELDSLRHSRDL